MAFDPPEKFEVISEEGIIAGLYGKELYLGHRKMTESREVAFPGEMLQRATALEKEGQRGHGASLLSLVAASASRTRPTWGSLRQF